MAFDKNQPRVPAGEPGGGRWVEKTFTSDEEVADDIQQIIEANKGDFSEFGLRVEDVATPAATGDILPNSRVWDDGEPTGDTLAGTSTFGVSDRSSIHRAMRDMGLLSTSKYQGYFGKVVYLVAGNSAEAGEDAGEKIIKSAKVIAVYTRDKDAFAPIKRRI